LRREAGPKSQVYKISRTRQAARQILFDGGTNFLKQSEGRTDNDGHRPTQVEAYACETAIRSVLRLARSQKEDEIGLTQLARCDYEVR
jgi:hypothetical protein